MEKSSTKTVLFEKAMELFRREGYKNVTIRQICKESGVTRNAFYYYFESKEAILCSYFENIPTFTQALFEELVAIPNDWEKLWYLIEAHMKLTQSEGISICRAFIKANMEGNGDLLSKYYVSETVTVPLVRSCQNSGLIRNMTEPNRLIFIATRLLLGVLVTWCSKDGNFDLIAVSKEAFFSLMEPSRD